MKLSAISCQPAAHLIWSNSASVDYYVYLRAILGRLTTTRERCWLGCSCSKVFLVEDWRANYELAQKCSYHELLKSRAGIANVYLSARITDRWWAHCDVCTRNPVTPKMKSKASWFLMSIEIQPNTRRQAHQNTFHRQAQIFLIDMQSFLPFIPAKVYFLTWNPPFFSFFFSGLKWNTFFVEAAILYGEPTLISHTIYF